VRLGELSVVVAVLVDKEHRSSWPSRPRSRPPRHGAAVVAHEARARGEGADSGAGCQRYQTAVPDARGARAELRCLAKAVSHRLRSICSNLTDHTGRRCDMGNPRPDQTPSSPQTPLPELSSPRRP